MKYYRPRPRLFQAYRIDIGDWDTLAVIANWCGGQLVDIQEFRDFGDDCVIYIEAGEHGDDEYASDGDWIIQRDGQFHVIAPEVFERDYEQIPLGIRSWTYQADMR